MKSLEKESMLAKGNRAFREMDYNSAINFYEEAYTKSPFLAHIVEFNLILARKRANEYPTRLKCPSGLDDYAFAKIIESGLFNSEWYYNEYGSRFTIGDNPLEHYLTTDLKLGLNPSPDFDTRYYILHNHDLANLDIHPFIHYVLQGRSEGRQSIGYQTHITSRYVPIMHNLPPLKHEKPVRVIAFYLPQFHQIPENDKWWGEGFTEWHNVKPALPLFRGHYQPHIPDNHIGYYNLLDKNTQRKQIALAKSYGIEGFCFYYYRFTGKRLLEKPVENYFNDKSLDLPYCLCWANENWTRRWDGLDQDILIQQDYSPSDDLEFIADVSKHFADKRYIKINGKPLLLIYRPNLFPDIRSTVGRWRKWCKSNGIGEIYLAYPQSFESVAPQVYAFDAAIEFPPVSSGISNITKSVHPTHKDFQANVYDWKEFVTRSENYETSTYKLFRTLCPGWDNTARKKNKSSVLVNNTPPLFQRWLNNAISDTLDRFDDPDERLVFVNAWNEWAEGAHLEPDQENGFAYLEATRLALISNSILHQRKFGGSTDKLAICIHAFYPDVFDDIARRISEIYKLDCKLFISTTPEKYAEIEAIALRHSIPFEVHPYENRGRDILPLLKISSHIKSQGFQYLLKIHTKKSLHRTDGELWRNDIYDKLLDKKLISKICSYFDNNKNIGLIAPEGYVAPLSYYWGSNKENVAFLAGRLGFEELSLSDHKFIPGTMFYVRLSALEPILNISLPDEAFEIEDGQVDGTMAHAVERIFSLSAERVGFQLATTDQITGTFSSVKNDRLDITEFYEPGK